MLENCIRQQQSKYLVSDSVTIADFLVFSMYATMFATAKKGKKNLMSLCAL